MLIPKHWMNKRQNRGASYLEAVVAVILITVFLGAVGPLFVGQRQRNVDSELRTGAAAAAQTVLENFRRSFRNGIPALTPPGGQNQIQTVMGNQFTVNLRVEDFQGVGTDNTLTCSTVANPTSTARCIRIQVRSGSNIIYAIDTVYTQL